MNEEKIKSTKEKTKQLDEYIWRTNFKEVGLEKWFNNFKNNEDKDIARNLLSQFTYFNQDMIREMLVALYRDLFLYPIRQKIITQKSTLNLDEEINKTRFLGMGNPSESGTFLLYYFRQINSIKKELFIDSGKVQLNSNNNQITRYVYIDDMSITGSQICDYAADKKYTITAKKIKENNPNIEINCYLLFATKEAVEEIKKLEIFEKVETVFELDNSFNCFSSDSRYFKKKKDQVKARNMLITYKDYYKAESLEHDDIIFGYKKSSLLLGLAHNTPNNTLPIFWGSSDKWTPIFTRYGKNYDK